jgi:heme/copper-type cytochrome/quinol oxidase subunit 1
MLENALSIGRIQCAFAMVTNAVPCSLETRNVKKKTKHNPIQKAVCTWKSRSYNSMKTINRKTRIVEMDSKASPPYSNTIKTLSSKRQYILHTILTYLFQTTNFSETA